MPNENDSLIVNPTSTYDAQATHGVTPIVVDLGSKSKKAIKKLKKGRGKLMAEVSETVERVRANVGPDNRDAMPVVVVYRKKAGKRVKTGSMMPSIPNPFNMFR